MTVDSIASSSLMISWVYHDAVIVTSYIISYSNINTQCFTDSNNITGRLSTVTERTLTDLQEDTQYSITVIALLTSGQTVAASFIVTTMEAG